MFNNSRLIVPLSRLLAFDFPTAVFASQQVDTTIENTDTAHAGRPITYSELVKRTGTEYLPGVKLIDR